VRILLINWQDRENPQAGGAEIHLHEIFGRLAARGDDVRLLCGGWPGCEPSAVIDGIRVTRVGTRYTFPFVVRSAYGRLVSDWMPDVVVEDINKVPVFTPAWKGIRSSRPPVVALVPHLFGGTVFQEAPAPVAAAVWLAERPLPRVYRGVPFQAISESTKDDLVARGIPAGDVRVIYPGIDTIRYTPLEGTRAPVPTFAYLGRLKRYKGVDLVIRAFARMGRPDARLLIAGGGDHREALESLARSLDLADRVQFLGFISESQKLELLRSAWSLLFASPKEGWGITNLEAAACGTPVIASNSPGLRESVKSGETGFLVPHGDVDELCAAMDRIARNPGLVSELGVRARRFAETFTWDRAASETRQHLELQVQGG
jgi:glycosyltransferase involved in cell wall biosynthesis